MNSLKNQKSDVVICFNSSYFSRVRPFTADYLVSQIIPVWTHIAMQGLRVCILRR